MGRFPSRSLLARPEAQGLAEHFEPLCRLIVRGDYLAFRQHLSFDSPSAQWFVKKGILLALRNRCEILAWRSFCRKVFIHGGFLGDPQAQAQRGPPPILYLHKLLVTTRWLKFQHSSKQMNGASHSALGTPSFGPQTVSQPEHPEFAGLENPDTVTVPDFDHDILEKFGDFLAPDGLFDEAGIWEENVPGQLVDGDPENDYEGCEFNPYSGFNPNDTEGDQPSPLMREIESILASLLTQGLMRGYLTHRNPRFAIPGARLRGPLPTGFPNVWETISTREVEDYTVPGWI